MRILIILLLACATAFGQSNPSFRSITIQNSDSLHQQNNGTIYRHQDGLLRFIWNGVHYRFSTGAGITNSAINNELMKSNGTNAVSSGIFAATNGSLTLGNSISGAQRNIASEGSASNVGLFLSTKGDGNFYNAINNSVRLYIDGVTDFTGISNNGLQSPLRQLHVLQSSSATGTVTNILRLTSLSTGTPTTGIGTGMEFETQTSSGNNEIGAFIQTRATDVTLGSEDFYLEFAAMTNGAAPAVYLGINGNLGWIELGGPGTSGTERRIAATGTNSNIGLLLTSKGSAPVGLSTSDGNINLSAGPNGGTGVVLAQVGPTSTNTVATALRARRDTPTTAGTGIGSAIDFEVETSTTNTEIGSAIECVSTDITPTSEDFDFVIKTMTNGAAATEKARIRSDGAFSMQGIQRANSTKTGAYTITPADYAIGVDATSGSITITLPTAASSPGQEFVIVKIDGSGNTVTVEGNGSETINGAADYPLTTTYQFIKVQNFLGSYWVITGN